MPSGTVFFLSDYGLVDEFVGVVHAVLHRLAARVVVVDLTHQVPPYDVRAGAAALARAVPYLGPGVVLAVVDPGVGGPRRGLAVALADAGPDGAGLDGAGPDGGRPGSRWLVGPDNGLLLPAADRAGGIDRVLALDRAAVDRAVADRLVTGHIGTGRPGTDRPGAGGATVAATFDGRDLFGPAAALLVAGVDPETLGDPVSAAQLVRVPDPVVELGTLGDGRRLVRTEVTWVDRFGNAQLGADGDTVPPSVPVVTVTVATTTPGSTTTPAVQEAGPVPEEIRRVRTFSDLAAGQPGLLSDGNGRLALAVREGSAAARFGVAPGDLVELVW